VSAARLLAVWLVAWLVAPSLLPTRAGASGLDVPAVYAARHAALGGAAVGNVDDPSALYHNPAGLLGTRQLMLLADLSLVAGSVQTSPAAPDQNVATGTSVVPVPMLAFAWRVHRRVAIGFAAFPSGAAGAELHYLNSADVATVNKLRAILVELTPGVAVQPVRTLRLGLGYRVTVLSFDRELGAERNPAIVNAQLVGVNALGFRAGLEWWPLPSWSLGVAYRHWIDVNAAAAKGTLLATPVTDVKATLTLPATIALGTRVDVRDFGFVLDGEYIFNSQFRQIPLAATVPSQSTKLSLPFLFRWQDSVVVKAGVEYRWNRWRWSRGLATRIGYAFDGQASNRRYPDAFTAPPTNTHYLTGGVGYERGRYQVNLAGVYQLTSSTFIAAAEIANGSECPFCAKEGTYAARGLALMIDFSARLGRAERP
jgi:hypothetical protein